MVSRSTGKGCGQNEKNEELELMLDVLRKKEATIAQVKDLLEEGKEAKSLRLWADTPCTTITKPQKRFLACLLVVSSDPKLRGEEK